MGTIWHRPSRYKEANWGGSNKGSITDVDSVSDRIDLPPGNRSLKFYDVYEAEMYGEIKEKWW